MDELKLLIKPDEDEPEAAEVYVTGQIAGRNYHFLLDTGAARSSVGWDDYTATLTSEGTNHSSGVFTPMSADLITVPNLTVGSISRPNFTLTRTAVATPRTANLIGMDWFKDYCCHFLFAEQRVAVTTNGPSEGIYDWQPLFLDARFHPYMTVHLGADSAQAVWDTGASITVADLNFIHRHPAFFTEVGHSTGTDAAGTQVETPMFVLSGAVIGKQAFPPHKVAGVDLTAVNATIEVPMDLILGYNTWSKANWFLDFPRHQWCISKWLAGESSE